MFGLRIWIESFICYKRGKEVGHLQVWKTPNPLIHKQNKNDDNMF